MNERDDILEQLSAWLDGELPAEQARRVEQAVRTDPELAAEADSLRKLRRLVRTVPARKAPEGFAARVMARAERAHLLGQPYASISRSFRWISLAAAAVVLLSAGAAMVIIFYSAKPLPPPLAIAPKPNQPEPVLRRDPVDNAKGAPAPSVVHAPASTPRSPSPATPPGPAVAMKTEKESDTIPHVAKPLSRDKTEKGAEKTPRPEGPEIPALHTGKVAGDEPMKVAPAAKGGMPADLAVKAPAEDTPGILPKSRPAHVSKTAAGGQHRVVLFPDDLDDGRQAVEKVLARNGVKAAVEKKDAATSGPAEEGSKYRTEAQAEGRMEIVAYVTPQQMSQLQGELVALQSRWAQGGRAVLERKQVLPMAASSGTAGVQPPALPRPTGAASQAAKLDDAAGPGVARAPEVQPAGQAGQESTTQASGARTTVVAPTTQPAGQLLDKQVDESKDIKTQVRQVAVASQPSLVAQAVRQGGEGQGGGAARSTTQAMGYQTRPAIQLPGAEAVTQEAKVDLQPLVIALNVSKAKPAALAAKPTTQPARAEETATTTPAK